MRHNVPQQDSRQNLTLHTRKALISLKSALPNRAQIHREVSKLGRPVLGLPTIGGFHITEPALKDPERMLNLGSHLRDDPVDLCVELVQRTALGGFAHNTPERIAVLLRERGLPFGVDVALIAPDGCFLAAQ